MNRSRLRRLHLRKLPAARALLIACSFLCAPAAVFAKELPGPVPAQIIRVIDGDTVRVRAEVWPGQLIEAVVRLAGVSAPEVRRTCQRERLAGRRSRAYLETLLTQGREVVLTNVKRGKYFGRVIARIALDDGTDIGARMIASAYAVPYRARRRPFRDRLCNVALNAPL